MFITNQFIIQYLNELLEFDRESISELFQQHVIFEIKELSDEPRLIVRQVSEDLYSYGVLGILNGMICNKDKMIAMELDENNKIVKFSLIEI